MEIKILNNREINFIRWDQSISNSVNSLVYAKTWFLDIVCPDWQALIGGNYDYLMPICQSSKYFISYIYQPYFTQQLGLFSPLLPEEKIVNQFIDFLPTRYIEMNLNSLNRCSLKGIETTKRINYELDLIPNYSYISANYNENTRRNIRKAQKKKIQIIKGTSVRSFIDFYQSEISSIAPELKEKDYQVLQQIIAHSLRLGLGALYAAYSKENRLVSVAFFLKSQKRIILLANATNEEGKKMGAGFKIIDYFIKENNGHVLTLDFEGSLIKGVAKFYAGFGSSANEYLKIKRNKLPQLIKWIKP